MGLAFFLRASLLILGELVCFNLQRWHGSLHFFLKNVAFDLLKLFKAHSNSGKLCFMKSLKFALLFSSQLVICSLHLTPHLLSTHFLLVSFGLPFP